MDNNSVDGYAPNVFEKWRRWQISAAAVVPLALVAALNHIPLTHAAIEWLLGLVGKNIAELLALVALVFAAVQFEDAREQTHSLRAVGSVMSQRLSDVSASLSTRFIGEFPAYLHEIVEFVSDANASRIEIVCDYPAYGRFSNPDQFVRYRRALEDALRRGVRITMTSVSESLRPNMNKEQFGFTADTFSGWLAADETQARLTRLLHDLPGHTVAELSTMGHDSFLKIVDDANLEFEEAVLLKDVNHRRCSMLMSLHFWVIDDKKAIFSIPGPSHDMPELGFVTFDGKLLVALRQIARRYQTTVEPS